MPDHRAPVPPAIGRREEHGRRCACPGCHDAEAVTAAEGIAALELWLQGAHR